MEILHRYRLADTAGAITGLAWSEWHGYTAGRPFLLFPGLTCLPQSVFITDTCRVAIACLAASDSHGNVWNVEISQNAGLPHVKFAQLPADSHTEEEVGDVWAIRPLALCEADARPATQMRWIWTNGAVSLLWCWHLIGDAEPLVAADPCIHQNWSCQRGQTEGCWRGDLSRVWAREQYRNAS